MVGSVTPADPRQRRIRIFPRGDASQLAEPMLPLIPEPAYRYQRELSLGSQHMSEKLSLSRCLSAITQACQDTFIPSLQLCDFHAWLDGWSKLRIMARGGQNERYEAEPNPESTLWQMVRHGRGLGTPCTM
jgi:hypothetical protein